MNWLLVVSGLLALLTTIGHFTVGSRMYLRPMLKSDFDPVARKVMHCVFHYVSVFLTLSAVVLLGAGLGLDMGEGTTLVVRFISINYAAFALWQIVLAATSGIQGGLFKMFQWIFFVLIAATGWMGA